MIPQHRAIHICIVLALAMLAFDLTVYRLEMRRATVQAATAPTQREQVQRYPNCAWWIDAELWWADNCPVGAAPGLPVPEALR